MNEEKTAFYTTADSLVNVTGISKLQASRLISGIPFTKNSPLLPAFKSLSMRTAQLGITSKLVKEWFGKPGGQLPKENEEASVLTVGQVLFKFLVILFASGVSIGILCAELVYKTFFKTLMKN